LEYSKGQTQVINGSHHRSLKTAQMLRLSSWKERWYMPSPIGQRRSNPMEVSSTLIGFWMPSSFQDKTSYNIFPVWNGVVSRRFGVMPFPSIFLLNGLNLWLLWNVDIWLISRAFFLLGFTDSPLVWWDSKEIDKK